MTAATGARIATGLPPGWIELAAFADAAALETFLDAQLEVDRDRFTAQQREQIRNACVLGHQLVRDQSWQHVGAVVTHAWHGQQWQPTVWVVAVGLLPLPATGDIDPIAVAERRLPGMLERPVDAVEAFILDDGRGGVVLGTTTAAAIDPAAARAARQSLPQLDVDALGVYLCLLPPKDMPDHLAVVLGVAPNVAEREAMSVVAGQMAASVHLLHSVDDLPSANVLIDTTGEIHPGGSLPGAADA